MRRLLLTLLALTLLVAAACGSDGGSGTSDADSRIDELYAECEDGDDDACDDLYTESEAGSPEEAFGNNCGGRGLPPGEQWCGPERQAEDSSATPEPEPEPEPEPTPAPTNPPPDAPVSLDAARSEYVEACVATGGESSRPRCNCLFTYLVDTYGLQYLLDGPPNPQALSDEANAFCT